MSAFSDIQNSLNFSNKTVLVTGGGKGVGLGITQRFLACGANVIFCGRNQPDTIPKVENNEAIFMACDVRDIEQVQALIHFCVEKFGRLDVLVNNAGGAPFADAATASPRFSESIIRLNLLAPLNLCQAANAVMQKQNEGGVIINIASVSGARPSPGTAAYGAAKAGLLNLTSSLAVEWAPKVRLNAITAGLILTEQSELHYGNDEGVAAVANTVPLGRMAVPNDIGDACLFLASPLSSYVTGTSITLHGGGEKPAFLEAANTNKN